jgi:16S rRNA processing protein RimM
VTPEADTGSELVVVAEVVRAVGLKGEVGLFPRLDFHAPLLGSRFLCWDDGSAAPVRAARRTASGWIVHPIGCDDRATAEARVGRSFGFRRGDYLCPEFPRPPEGLPFRFLGRTIVTRSGEALGEVAEVRRHASQLTLVVRGAHGEVLIPAVAPILEPSDGLTGALVVDPPEGLLDVNA